MSTETIRMRIADAALAMGAWRHVWPNGLGFDWRGWEYTISEPDGAWCALRRAGDTSRHGKGATPHAAKANAQPLF